jgi:peptidoglycan/xylan/chitin deacetylase (PgdA/CDA1 family)
MILTISLGVRAFDLLVALVPGRSSSSGVVLYYHAVKPRQRARFARQMDELLKAAVPFAAGSPHLMRAGRQNIAVTFDDGFRSVVENAVPELVQRHIPFTVFVPSGSLGDRPSWVRDSRHPSWRQVVVSEAELQQLAQLPLATIGSHSMTHPANMAALDPARIAYELVESKAMLEHAAGVSIDLFSVPHGAYSDRVLAAARQAGYRHVFTIEPRAVGQGARESFAVGRFAADPDDWLVEFRLKASGAYRWRRYIRRSRRPEAVQS